MVSVGDLLLKLARVLKIWVSGADGFAETVVVRIAAMVVVSVVLSMKEFIVWKL